MPSRNSCRTEASNIYRELTSTLVADMFAVRNRMGCSFGHVVTHLKHVGARQRCERVPAKCPGSDIERAVDIAGYVLCHESATSTNSRTSDASCSPEGKHAHQGVSVPPVRAGSLPVSF